MITSGIILSTTGLIELQKFIDLKTIFIIIGIITLVLNFFIYIGSKDVNKKKFKY